MLRELSSSLTSMTLGATRMLRTITVERAQERLRIRLLTVVTITTGIYVSIICRAGIMIRLFAGLLVLIIPRL